MIPKTLHEIELKDIQVLIDEQREEGTRLEYKWKVEDDNSIISELISMANAQGGDLILGVKEEDGIPVEVAGIEVRVSEVDEVRQIWVNKIRDRVAPQISTLDIHTIKISDDLHVFIFRVSPSWHAPHGLKKKTSKSDKTPWLAYYTRTPVGKVPMEPHILKRAFIMHESIAARIRTFQDERVENAFHPCLPFIINGRSQVLLHIIPLSSFLDDRATIIDVNSIKAKEVPLMFPMGLNYKLNLEGFVVHSKATGGSNTDTYTQLWRNGIIEMAGKASTLVRGDGECLDGGLLKDTVLKGVSRALTFLEKNNIVAPYYIFCSLLHMKGWQLMLTDGFYPAEDETLDRERGVLQEIVIDNPSLDIERELEPLFGSIWNALGQSWPE